MILLSSGLRLGGQEAMNIQVWVAGWHKPLPSTSKTEKGKV
jgi:hypothetical protein